MLPLSLASPSKFVLFFTLSVISLLVGLSFLKGPRTYLNTIFKKKNWPKTGFLFGSLIMSLYFSLISPSYIFSIIFCVVEFSAVLYYFFNIGPTGTLGLRAMAGTAKEMVRSGIGK